MTLNNDSDSRITYTYSKDKIFYHPLEDPLVAATTAKYTFLK